MDLATDKLVHPEIHFTVFVPEKEPPQLEVIEHGSAAESRLIQLLEDRIRVTKEAHEKKNAVSLVQYLKNRHQKFPRAHGGKWDLTPLSLKY